MTDTTKIRYNAVAIIGIIDSECEESAVNKEASISFVFESSAGISRFS